MTYNEYKEIEKGLKNGRSREYRRRKAAWAPGVWNTEEGRIARNTANHAIADYNTSLRMNRQAFQAAVEARGLPAEIADVLLRRAASA